MYSAPASIAAAVPVARFVRTPPADTLVLLGYVRDQAHWDWIKNRKLYNLRAYAGRGRIDLTSRELACNLIVLSCRPLDQVALARVATNPEVHTIESMRELQYPEPRGAYFCLPLEFIVDERWQRLLSTQAIERVRRSLGATRGLPSVISWHELTAQLVGGM